MTSASVSGSLAELFAELERMRVAAQRLVARAAVEIGVPEDATDEFRDMVVLLVEARSALMQNPIAAKGLVGFLVSQGEDYAATTDGMMMQAALLESPGMGRLRELWNVLSLGVFDEVGDAREVPTAWMDLLSDVLASGTGIDELVRVVSSQGRGNT